MLTTTAGKLYRHTADDIHNEIAAEIGGLTPKVAEQPARLAMYAANIERLRGQADVLQVIETQFSKAVEWGVANNWTVQQVMLVQYDILMELATADPNDASSGRGGDARRSYQDGRREVIRYVARRLRYSDHFPGND
jgi:hypothetical protein